MSADVDRFFDRIAAERGCAIPADLRRHYRQDLLFSAVHFQFRPREWYADEDPMCEWQPGGLLPFGAEGSGDVYGLFCDPLWPEHRAVVCWFHDTGELAPLTQRVECFLQAVVQNHVVLAAQRPEFMTSWESLRPFGDALGLGPFEPMLERLSAAQDFHRLLLERDPDAPAAHLFLGMHLPPGDPRERAHYEAAARAAPWYAHPALRLAQWAEEAGDEPAAAAALWEAVQRLLCSWGTTDRSGHAAFREVGAPPPDYASVARRLRELAPLLGERVRGHPTWDFLCRQHPEDVEARLELVRNLLRGGFYREAVVQGENARFLAAGHREFLRAAYALTLDGRTLLGHDAQVRILKRQMDLMNLTGE